MTDSPVPLNDGHRRELRTTIESLETQALAHPTALLADHDRAAVDRAIVHALRELTDDQALHGLLARFAAGDDRRPAQVADVVITLRLLEQALQQT